MGQWPGSREWGDHERGEVGVVSCQWSVVRRQSKSLPCRWMRQALISLKWPAGPMSMTDDTGFIRAIHENPEDASLLLIYADWLEERGDIRADFLRLQTRIRSLDPDHPHRPEVEGRLSYLRKSIDASWVALIELQRGHGDNSERSCKCIQAWHNNRRFPESRFHVEAQNTECDAWKRLLDLVEEAAADGRSDFEPRGAARDLHEWSQIVALPPTIVKLKSVKKLRLYGSHLIRIPPEIGEMASLEDFDPYTSYWLHWFPYEITRCKNLKRSRVSTRALYGNYKYRPPFPRLRPAPTSADRAPRYQGTDVVRNCSVCNRPFEDRGLHRLWISLRVATDVLPLLVNACSQACVENLPQPPQDYVQKPHLGGLNVQQPPTRFTEVR